MTEAKRRRELRAQTDVSTTIRKKGTNKANNTRRKTRGNETKKKSRMSDRIKSFRKIKRRKNSAKIRFAMMEAVYYHLREIRNIRRDRAKRT